MIMFGCGFDVDNPWRSANIELAYKHHLQVGDKVIALKIPDEKTLAWGESQKGRLGICKSVYDLDCYIYWEDGGRGYYPKEYLGLVLNPEELA